MVILARRYWPKECERCNWWRGTNDNATQAGPSTRGDGHRRSGAARDEEATEIQFKPKSRCDVRPGILPGKMSPYAGCYEAQGRNDRRLGEVWL